MADCCCSMGEAWGESCELCPVRYTPEYQELCLDSGFLIDGRGKYSTLSKLVSIKSAAPK